MLTDNAVHDLVQMLQTLHAAADISHLNLSHNQLLTGQCCGPLGQLLSMAAGNAAQPNRNRRDSIHSKNCDAPPSAAVDFAECCQGNMDSTAGSVHAGGGNRPVVGLAGCLSGTGTNCPADPAGWSVPQPSFRQLLQPLQLQVLLLEGVALGDRGAAALAGALSGTQHLQVSRLSWDESTPMCCSRHAAVGMPHLACHIQHASKQPYEAGHRLVRAATSKPETVEEVNNEVVLKWLGL